MTVFLLRHRFLRWLEAGRVEQAMEVRSGFGPYISDAASRRSSARTEAILLLNKFVADLEKKPLP